MGEVWVGERGRTTGTEGGREPLEPASLSMVLLVPLVSSCNSHFHWNHWNHWIRNRSRGSVPVEPEVIYLKLLKGTGGTAGT